jgi:formiminoglutamate deiminase
MHIHIAEQVKEVADCQAWSGARPVEWLLGNADVGRQWCLVHATHMTPDETAALARSGAIAGLCPITEANLGDGLFPAAEFLGSGGQLGVGSDSNVLIDAAEELRLLEYGQRLSRRSRNVLACEAGGSTGANLYRGALEGGAQALGVESGLKVGASADIVSFAPDHAVLIGRSGDAVLYSYIFAGRRDMIDGVWRAGKKLVANGRHHRRAEISTRYRQVLQRVLT